MRNRTRAALPAAAGLLALTLTAIAGQALSGDQDQPIDIIADGVELDDGRHISTYSGNVEVQQGSMRLWADRVMVHHEPSRRPHHIVAEGAPARYRQLTDDRQEVKARAGRMEYDAGSNELILIGDAVLTQGQDTFASDRILYDRDKAVVKGGASAKGRQRVRITLTPDHR